MKVILNRSQLATCVQNAQKAVSTKSAMPILEGLLISAKEGFLTVTGFDQELGITQKMEAQVLEEGNIVLNARVFGDMVRSLESDSIKMENADAFVMKITGGMTEYTLLGLDASDFPNLPKVEAQSQLTLEQATLKQMIKQTLFVVSQNESKPILTGVLFRVEEKMLKMVACDGCRLALCKEPVAYAGNINVVIPSKTLNELLKLLKEEEGEQLSVTVGRNHICFVIDGCVVISRLLEGNYIDYASAIPNQENTRVLVQTRALAKCVDKTSLILNDRLRSSVRLTIGGNLIRTYCQTAQGQAHDEIEVQQQGDEITIALSSKYISDALRACETEEVYLLLSNPLKPVRIIPKEGDAFLFLIMPVRMKEDQTPQD